MILAFVAASLVSLGVSKEARAGGSADAVAVQVSGSALGNLSSSPLGLSPNFAQSITDYVWRCQSGINRIQLTLTAASSGMLSVEGRSGRIVTLEESLIENQAVVIRAPDPNNTRGIPVQYWIRCLPHDFPQLSVVEPGSPPPGWYLTGNVNSAAGSGTYAMVLDSQGTPVWYQASGVSALNITLLADGTIAWMSGSDFSAFKEYNLNTQATRRLAGPGPSLDFHELLPMSNGDLMMLSNPLKPSVDMTIFGGTSSATVIDCVLEEVDPNGQLIWQWRASDHISVGESTHPLATSLGQQVAYDLFHCNSIDVDPVSGNVLLSARHTDSVYLIDKTSGDIIWKMGGTSFNHDQAQILAITGDPEGAFHGQHDARFHPNGDVSLYDNQSWDPSLAARGVEYHIDSVAGTATMVWSYQSPDGHNSAATGSFRRLSRGTDNVIGWGIKPGPLFTEVDAASNTLLNVTFPNGEFAYRVQKVGPTALDHNLLRATAGLAPFSFTADRDPTISGTGVTLSTAEGMGLTDTVATFSDTDSNASADEYLATIAWGDGSSSPGTISGPIGGPFTVTGTHNYAEEGTSEVTVYVTDVDDPTNRATVTSTVNVSDATLSASCAALANSLTSYDGTTANFTDADPSGTESDHTATIAWGDGSSSPGTVSGPDGGPFTVSGAHSYVSTGNFNITTTVNDAGGSSTSASCNTLIYAFPSGAGAFAIGDESSAIGEVVTFWSSKWSRLNSLSGGPAPGRFNGLWQSSAMSTCEVGWEVMARTSDAPPAGPLPAYMGVIVNSSVRQSGSTDSGSAVHLVIVRTNPGYEPDPGHAGTGMVVAQIC